MFTRQRYDRGVDLDSTSRSITPHTYRLDPTYTVSYNNPGAGDQVRTGTLIDVDSIMRGYTGTGSRGTLQPTHVSAIPALLQPTAMERPASSFSRYTNPHYDLKQAGYPASRSDYPLYDPQCHIYEPTQVNTRLMAKDGFKPYWKNLP